MITLIGYQEYKESPVVPEWYKAERYDYCENFLLARRERANGFFKRIALALSHRKVVHT